MKEKTNADLKIFWASIYFFSSIYSSWLLSSFSGKKIRSMKKIILVLLESVICVVCPKQSSLFVEYDTSEGSESYQFDLNNNESERPGVPQFSWNVFWEIKLGRWLNPGFHFVIWQATSTVNTIALFGKSCFHFLIAQFFPSNL